MVIAMECGVVRFCNNAATWFFALWNCLHTALAPAGY